VRRLLLAAALLAAVLAAGASPAAADTGECKGFLVCVPVAGPWVVVPTEKTVPRPRVEYQLTCPRGYVVGGLDAELTDRQIDLAFLGLLGTPVNPGITTVRSAVFVASYVGSASGAQSFRPHVGCIPSTGGGRRIPTSAAKTVPPGQPTVRRTRTARIQAGLTRTVTASCRAGEQLVGASHALGFYTQAPPAQAMVSAAHATERIRGRSVAVAARGGLALAPVRAVVQVTAVCAGGS
jgi:hypothetical protein